MNKTYFVLLIKKNEKIIETIRIRLRQYWNCNKINRLLCFPICQCFIFIEYKIVQFQNKM